MSQVIQDPDPFYRIARLMREDQAFTISFDSIDGCHFDNMAVQMFWHGCEWIVVEKDGLTEHIRISSIIRVIINTH